MSNIYIPIDYSDVASIIPEGEDILYSTLCHVKERGGVGPTRYKKTYNSHVVLTTNGIAFEVKRKLGKTRYNYIPYITKLFQVRIKPNNKFNAGVGVLYSFQLRHAIDFESKTQFNERSQIFYQTMIPIYFKAIEKNIEESPPGRHTEKKKRYLQKFKSKS
ncbi:hypothetical protein ES703_65261 [subsurface metagenome]